MSALSIDDFDLFDPKTLAEPYEYYRLLRREAPVHRVRHHGLNRDIYLVTTHPLCREVFNAPERFSSGLARSLNYSAAKPSEAAAKLLATAPWDGSVMIAMDGEEHRRARALTTAALTPERIKQVTDSLEKVVDSLIDKFAARGHVDFVEEFAVPFTVGIIMSLFNTDRSLGPKFREWSDASILRMSHMHSEEEELAAIRSLLEFQNYVVGMIAERRRQPGDDLLSGVIQATAKGYEPLTDKEVLRSMLELIVGGNETSRNTMTGGIVALIQNPEQMNALIADPSLIPNAVEEVLRHFSTSRSLWRVAACDTELGGVPIPKGAAISLRLESANRDETVFPDGDRFDIHRTGVRNHLSFGNGLHTCVGNFLARKELATAYRGLLARLKNLRIDYERSDLTPKPSVHFRVYKKVHLLFDT